MWNVTAEISRKSTSDDFQHDQHAPHEFLREKKRRQQMYSMDREIM